MNKSLIFRNIIPIFAVALALSQSVSADAPVACRLIAKAMTVSAGAGLGGADAPQYTVRYVVFREQQGRYDVMTECDRAETVAKLEDANDTREQCLNSARAMPQGHNCQIL